MKTPPALYWVSKSLLSPRRTPPPPEGTRWSSTWAGPQSPTRRPPQGVAVPLPHPGIHGSLAPWQVQAGPRSVKDRQGGEQEQRALSWTWALNSGWPNSILAPLLRPYSGSEPSRCGGQTAGASQGACGLKSAALPADGHTLGYFGSLSSEPGPVAFIPEPLEVWSEVWYVPPLSRICPVPRAPPRSARVEWAATAPSLASCCSQPLQPPLPALHALEQGPGPSGRRALEASFTPRGDGQGQQGRAVSFPCWLHTRGPHREPRENSCYSFLHSEEITPLCSGSDLPSR